MIDAVFQPIVDQSRPDMVTARLREMIADGTLSEGQQLVEVDLVAGFGVSRSTVRESLQRLVQEGLLVSVPHRGVFVREITPDDVVDIYAARRTIETTAALRLARADDAESLAQMRRAHDEMTRAALVGDARALTQADQFFHDILTRSLGSARIDRLGETLRLETRLCLARLEGRYVLPLIAVDEHLAIIEAIESADPAAIIATIDAHMDNATQLLLKDAEEQVAAEA